MPKTLAIVDVPLALLRPHSQNYQQHPPEQLKKLAADLSRFGQRKNIVVQQQSDSYLIVAGHGLVDAARSLKLKTLKADILPADTPEDEILGYMVADNETARWAEPDLAQLERLLQEQLDAGYPLESVGYDLEALEALQQQLKQEASAGQRRAIDDPGGGGDDFDTSGAETRCKPGELWQLGRHRLLCGDSTKTEDVARLMGDAMLDLIVTDPPYGVNYADKNRFLNAVGRGNRIQEPILGDDGKIEDIAEALWKPAFTTMHDVAREGCVIYCHAPQGGDQMMMMMMMMSTHWPVRHELMWLKNNHVLGRADYAYKHEPILYAWKGSGHKYYGGFQTSVLEFDKPQKSDIHPTMKPIALIAHLIGNNSLEGENVGDWFLGSGSTLIAAERTGRACYGLEIDPHYASVILARWEAETGEKAVRL